MNTPIYYSAEQMETMQERIMEGFGCRGEAVIGHEIESEYVHSDVLAFRNEDGESCFVTFGMSARKMNSPLEDLERVELMMYASDVEIHSSQAAVVMGALQGLTKVPFRDNTFFGPGHTVCASERFRETFGFDAFVLLPVSELEMDGEVMVLLAVPIYQAEREKMMEEGSFAVVRRMAEAFGVEMMRVDSGRACLPD